MDKKLFHFDLPPELIAQTPLEQREASRLLICNGKNKSISDSHFSSLPKEIEHIFALNHTFSSAQNESKKALLIANDSKVYPARIRIRRKSGSRGEVFLLEIGSKENYRCLLRPQKKIHLDEILYADREDILIPLFKVVSLNPCLVTPHNENIETLLQDYGEMPLPPYISRDPKKNSACFKELDIQRYQTTYANHTGSAAAPTAGLHFTQDILKECKKTGIDFTTVTLHVSLSTFQPVLCKKIHEHVMHEEYYF
ncbi:MAG: S-adenosylmethionine:tRNA ribosyltransferase-isomerase, partial [Silvanigrellaceae bacterium]|nr:S-adenosylmethionine:tRNA ribosyltransferase-isomerase [Silvanigrellaceae bacterium]